MLQTHEIPDNGIDDDGNGFIDDVHGWDFYENDNGPNDRMGHGTWVTGIAVARGANAIEICGICPNCRFLPVAVTDPDTLVDGESAADEASFAQVRLREELECTITVTIGGPADATNVTVTDTLPQEVTLEEALEDCEMYRGTLVCSVASQPAGETEEFEFKVIVSWVPEDRLLINQATVTADQADVNPSNNRAQAVTQVIGSQSRRESDDERGRDDDRGRSMTRSD